MLLLAVIKNLLLLAAIINGHQANYHFSFPFLRTAVVCHQGVDNGVNLHVCMCPKIKRFFHKRSRFIMTAKMFWGMDI